MNAPPVQSHAPPSVASPSAPARSPAGSASTPSFAETLAGGAAPGGPPPPSAGLEDGASPMACEPPTGLEPAGMASGPSALGALHPTRGLDRRDTSPGDDRRPRDARPDPLDPATRHAAQLLPPLLPPAPSTTVAPPATTDVHARASLEAILPELVRRIAWAGDGRRGSVRLELGGGALAGGTVMVHADGGRVRVELDAPAGVDVDAWRGRLHERLARRGVDVEEVLVR